MHAIEIVITSIVTIAASFGAAWYGARAAAKRNEKAQAHFLQKLSETNNSLSAIARRLPGGQAYAAVKQAERRIAEEKTSEDNAT
jgi:cell division protein FtsB